jgi:hypothetical protein
VAGASCVDFLSIGRRGATAVPTITHDNFIIIHENSPMDCPIIIHENSIIIHENSPLIIHENSPLFRTDLLVAFFCSNYFIFSVVRCPTAFGWPVRRRGRFTVLRHGDTVLEAVSTLHNVLRLFDRGRGCAWREFFVAPSEERLAELRLAAPRMGSL